MRLDKINNVFRPGDYALDLRWFRSQVALETLLKIGSLIQFANPKLVITCYQKETFEPFTWNKGNVQNAILDSKTRYLQLRGDNKRLDSPTMVFRTGVEGIDLSVILRIIDHKQPLIKIVSLDFEEEHLNLADYVFSSELLQNLFTNLVLDSLPDYAVLRRIPPVTADWYWETQAKIDTQKIPVTFDWLNFFSWDWVKRIGEEKFDHCPEGDVKKIPAGLLYFMQKEPFSYSNPEHTSRQTRVNNHFTLEKLHKKYKT